MKSTIQYAASNLKDNRVVMQPLGLDAKQTLAPLPSGKKLLAVIVVGETARAKNFSLYGYKQETNPELKNRISSPSPIQSVAAQARLFQCPACSPLSHARNIPAPNFAVRKT